ncbi:MAG: EAL domain-containing protein [Acidimicrobiales bacterium]|nr:EAL domain-containing protein [Acidimicrobiales bacterium]MCB9394664.1 EAL domain-containing protein [Acidimicrobiaceae bacterium]
MGAPALDDDARPRRGPRGVRSLAGRLVLLLAIPLLAAQSLALFTLQDRHRTADEARMLADRIEFVGDIGLMFAPVALETVASTGLVQVDAMGVDREIVREVTNIDYESFLDTARVQLDDALDHLVERFADRRLPSGRRLGDEVASVRAGLVTMRAALDARTADIDSVDRAMSQLDQLMTELLVVADELHGSSSSNSGLGAISEHVSHLLSLTAVLSDETEIRADVLGPSASDDSTTEILLAMGAADAIVDQYTSQLGDDDEHRWRPMLERLDRSNARRGEVIELAEVRSASVVPGAPNVLLTDPVLIRQVAELLRIGFEDLGALGEYTASELARYVEQADAVAAAADDEVRFWTGIIVVVTLASVGFLILIAVGTSRPLAKLTARALDLSEGVVDPRPLRLSGPSDVRAVMATFNTVTRVLASFERQMRRLGSGDDLRSIDSDAVPGTLGESLRAQVTHVAEMTQRLRESEAFARAVIETAADAIWTIDPHGRILSANDTAEAILGLGEREQVGRSLFRLVGAANGLLDLAGEAEITRPDGSTVDVLISHSEVRVASEPIHTVFARDISDRKRFEQQLAQQARHDLLTHLPNRLAALEHLEKVVGRLERHSGSVAVLFVDLDGFKSVNDSCGHASGDRLLHEVGRRLHRSVRALEFVARLGGDEFLVVCEGLDAEQGAALAERLIGEIAQPYESDGELFSISASVGIAVAEGPASIDALELIREADVAVYHAKERGRARVVIFDETLQEAVEATAEIELALRRAIGAGELVLHHQPVLDLATGRPWGTEALVRWNRPGHGLLAPDRFVPVAERSSLVIDLGRWVLHDACRTLASWQQDPGRRDLHVAVNVSGRHLVDGNLVHDVDEVIAATGIDPCGLELELTETHLLADFERANEVLTELRRRGITIAVDDFGTGYSSMGYLRQLEIDTLKIDRMFIARVNDAGYDRTIVEVLVQLGLTLGLGIVAEGVETPEQLDFLRGRRCSRAQGFHIARPMPVDDLDQWLAERELAPTGARAADG